MRGQGSRDLAELGEDEHLLLPGGDDLSDLTQPAELAAVRLRPARVAQPLRGMIADLLEAHQEGEDEPLAPDSRGTCDPLAQLPHRLLVEGGLLAAQGAEGLDLGLVRKVGDDRLVGLEPAQDVRAHQLPQRLVGVVGPLGHPLREGRELLGRAEQAGVDEIEDRPQVKEAVLDGGAGEGDPRASLELLGRFRLLGGRVLDGLRLVEHDQVPRRAQQPGEPQQGSVAGDDQINGLEPPRRERLQLGGGQGGGMGHEHPQPRREATGLGSPVRQVAQQICMHHSMIILRVEAMPTNERVTVTLPAEVVRNIDRLEKNRSKFVLDAVRHELKRRRRQDLQRSLRSPHPESDQLAEAGFGDWASGLPEEDAADLVDMKAGTPVRWVPGEGWVEASE